MGEGREVGEEERRAERRLRKEQKNKEYKRKPKEQKLLSIYNNSPAKLCSKRTPHGDQGWGVGLSSPISTHPPPVLEWCTACPPVLNWPWGGRGTRSKVKFVGAGIWGESVQKEKVLHRSGWGVSRGYPIGGGAVVEKYGHFFLGTWVSLPWDKGGDQSLAGCHRPFARTSKVPATRAPLRPLFLRAS